MVVEVVGCVGRRVVEVGDGVEGHLSKNKHSWVPGSKNVPVGQYRTSTV